VLDEGERIPDATVWTAPNRRASLHDLVSEGRVLLLFYLFDWSST
jgi:peroxiredoxin